MVAMLYDVFLGAKDNPYLAVVQTTGASYYARVKGNPRHTEVPPHLHLAAALMHDVAILIKPSSANLPLYLILFARVSLR